MAAAPFTGGPSERGQKADRAAAGRSQSVEERHASVEHEGRKQRGSRRGPPDLGHPLSRKKCRGRHSMRLSKNNNPDEKKSIRADSPTRELLTACELLRGDHVRTKEALSFQAGRPRRRKGTSPPARWDTGHEVHSERFSAAIRVTLSERVSFNLRKETGKAANLDEGRKI